MMLVLVRLCHMGVCLCVYNPITCNVILLFFFFCVVFFFCQAEDGIRDLVRSRGLGDVYKRQVQADISLAQKSARVAQDSP